MTGLILTLRADLPDPDSAPYLKAARTFADAVLEHGRDRYGETRTPLFVDGLHSETLEPAVWHAKNDKRWVLSNFANQQPLMRLLDGLSTLTGDVKYREAAEAAADWMLVQGAGPNGLLYWGRQVVIDLNHDAPVGFRIRHSTRAHQPYYELMWRVNPEATERLMSVSWMAHVLDWERLDYNRGAHNNREVTINWDHPFDENQEVPFPATSDNLSFAASTAFYVRTGVSLTMLGGDERPLIWSKRMLNQWQRARHPETGLSGGQLSWREDNDRAEQAFGHAYPGITEANIVGSYHQTGRYHILPLTQMQAGELLLHADGAHAATGRAFIEWAVDDLITYIDRTYDPSSGLFLPMMTDGTVIDAARMRGHRYYRIEDFLPQEADGDLIWGLAKAYRYSRDERLWRMLRELARQDGIGELGMPDGKGELLNPNPPTREWRWIYALLELHKASAHDGLLRAAGGIADNLIATQTPTGLFPRSAPEPKRPGAAIYHAKYPVDDPQYMAQPDRVYAQTGDEIPLALLHLAAAMEGRGDALPQPVYDTRGFRIQYHGDLELYQRKQRDRHTYDWLIFYGPDEKW